MKKSLLFLFVIFFSLNFSIAQINKFVKFQSHEAIEAPGKYKSPEDLNRLDSPQPDESASSRCENDAGTTFHDVQTYGSMPSMLHSYGDGRFSSIWQTGQDAGNGFPDRGTGYNYFDGTDWVLSSSDRIEGDTRTGFPAFTVLANEMEVSVAHKTPAPYELRTYSKMAGTTEWTENIIPSEIPGGPVWPFITSGGADGNTIHVIGVSVATAFGGEVYEGMDQHLLYWRSQDAGLTWDVTDQIIPGCDSTYYDGMPAEGYSIDANGNTVAVAIFDSWGDMAVFKSIDNGTSWERIVIKDFPLDKYVADSGYTYDDLVEDPNAPDSLAINTNDGAGTVIVDNNGMVHVFYGNMYVTDQNLTNMATEYFPTTSGMMYWNETHGADSVRLIADVQDFNGNDMIDIVAGEYGNYNTGLTSHPSVGIDDDNSIYMAYTAVREDYYNDVEFQHYRHTFMIFTTDDGASWTEPVDVLNAKCSDFSPILEAVYPSVARHVDDNVHLTYVRDFSPGLGVWIVDDEASENSIVLTTLNKETLELVNVENISFEKESLEVFPNPSNDQIEIRLELLGDYQMEVELFDQMGRRVKTINTSQQSRGLVSDHFSVSDLANGLYFLKISLDGQILSRKIVVQ